MKDYPKLIFSYLKSRLGTYAVYIGIILLYCFISFLCDLPHDPVLYATILSVTAIVIFEIIRFMRYCKRHKILRQIICKAEVEISRLPDGRDIIDKDFCELILMIEDQKKSLVSEYDSKASNMQEYYSMWAHQIKTPIAAMNLLLQSSDFIIEDELKEQLFKIEQYVDMVMQYLRADSLSNDMVIEHCSLDEIVKAAVRKYRKQFIRQKISLNFVETNCMVLTDEKWLQFVIEQILSNSLKYSKEGSVSIFMDDSQPKTLVISDQGIGIRAEDLPRIFDNGFTGYNGRADKKSTGIGLYLCKKILNRLSHKITVESVVDEGTTVKICLDSSKMFFE